MFYSTRTILREKEAPWPKPAVSGAACQKNPMARNFKDLSEREIVALAISLEEEDGRIYGDFIDGLRDTYPASAKMFEEMQAEESEHRASLIEMYRRRFGE